MKNCRVLCVFLALAAMSIPNAAKAQNYVKETTFQTDNNKTIVRSINDSKRVVYTENRAYGENLFLFYTDDAYIAGSALLPQYIFWQYFVNDFVIYKDSIYLCGYKKSTFTGDSTGIFGYIKISDPSLTNYCDIPKTIQMRKIQVFEDAGKPHIVMVGDKSAKESTIAEARINASNNWNILLSQYDTIVPKNRYYDLTVTDQYVVVTSKSRNSNLHGYIHVFDRPTTYLSIFFNQASMITTGHVAYGPFWVERRNGDKYTTVAKTTLNMGYYFACYDGLNNTAISNYPCSGCTLLDMAYNPVTNKTNVLLKYTQNNVVWYEIVPHAESGGMIVLSHRTSEYAITSLDCIGGTNNMIASGYSLDNSNILLFKYQPNTFSCFTQRSPYGSVVTQSTTVDEEEFEYVAYKRSHYPVENKISGYQISTLCE